MWHVEKKRNKEAKNIWPAEQKRNRGVKYFKQENIWSVKEKENREENEQNI